MTEYVLPISLDTHARGCVYFRTLRKLLTSVFFAAPGDDRWLRLARVLEHTARVHCPGWDIDVRQLDPPPAPSGALHDQPSYIANTHKLDEWARIVSRANDGDKLVLIDADTMLLGPLDGAFDTDFDVAITAKPNTRRFRVNAGVVFVRVNARSRAWFDAWAQVNAQLMIDRARRAPLLLTFGGVNQAALGDMRARMTLDARVVELDARKWNACYEPLWRDLRNARVLHIKSSLRRAVFTQRAPSPLKRAAALWSLCDRDACDHGSSLKQGIPA